MPNINTSKCLDKPLQRRLSLTKANLSWVRVRLHVVNPMLPLSGMLRMHNGNLVAATRVAKCKPLNLNVEPRRARRKAKGKLWNALSQGTSTVARRCQGQTHSASWAASSLFAHKLGLRQQKRGLRRKRKRRHFPRNHNHSSFLRCLLAILTLFGRLNGMCWPYKAALQLLRNWHVATC